MVQSQEELPFLVFFILIGKKSSSGFGIISINYACMASSTITVSYLDSPNVQFCCPWKRGLLIPAAYLKKTFLVSSKYGASSNLQVQKSTLWRCAKSVEVVW